MKLQPFSREGKTLGYLHWCPGCNGFHSIWIEDANSRGAKWAFDGNLEAPTFSPSVRLLGSEDATLCHYFIRAGKIEFCSDSPHALAGQTVELPDIPENS